LVLGINDHPAIDIVTHPTKVDQGSIAGFQLKLKEIGKLIDCGTQNYGRNGGL